MRVTFAGFFICAIVVFLMLHTHAVSQTFEPYRFDSTAGKSELRIGIRYTSDYYYMGRYDSTAAPYLSPSIGYFHKSGFFARTSLSYLTSSGEHRVDLIVLSGGYDYGGTKVGAGISINEYIFSDLSYAVQAEMSTYLNVYAGYMLMGFVFYLDGSVGFSEGTDFFIGGEMNRSLYALGRKLKITPGLYVNAGTQKYYDAFYANRSISTGAGQRNGKGHGGKPTSLTPKLTIVEADAFKLLDYETDLQVSYTIGKVRFYIIATWTFPVNPASVISNNDIYEEELKNGFYWSSGVRVSF